MADFYRGSTPTFIFVPDGEVSGSPHIIFTQGDVRLSPTVTVSDGSYRCTLTSAQTSMFQTADAVTVQLSFTTLQGVTYMPVHHLSVGENYYDFQEALPEEEDDGKSFLEAAPDIDDNPSEYGWYELVDGEYVLTADTTPVIDKEYYIDIDSIFLEETDEDEWEPTYNLVDDFEEDDSPLLDEWYELVDGKYVRSTDAEVDSSKTYYVLDDEDEGYADEYDEFAELFDGDAFAEAEGLDTDWESDLDESDTEPWDPLEEFTEADNLDDFIITYNEVTPIGDESPVNEAWLELIDGEYEFSDDEVVDSSKTYYDMVFEDPEEGE